MYVFELVQPGCWLRGIADDQVRRDVESLLHLLVTCVEDATLALNMFENSRDRAYESAEDRSSSWESDRVRERAVEEELLRQLPHDLTPESRFQQMDNIRESARREAKRMKWREGHLPQGYQDRIPFIHAKSCVYALDTLQKTLRLLAKVPDVPIDIAEVLKEFELAFPDLVQVRDSSHHAEDRVQGKRRKDRIELKPLVNEAIHAPGGGVLVVDMLNGNRYGGTLGDGSYGEVDVSPQTVSTAQQCVQRALNAFDWHGPVMHMPR